MGWEGCSSEGVRTCLATAGTDAPSPSRVLGSTGDTQGGWQGTGTEPGALSMWDLLPQKQTGEGMARTSRPPLLSAPPGHGVEME